MGAILALMLTRSELDVMSIIGIILLIGIVKKNAIMMIDFALNAERNEGKNTRDSIFEASMLRFRPILMTTMAALFGAVPLAIGTGMGSELRRPLGISIIGGLIVSQISHSLHHAGHLPVHGQRLRLRGRPASGSSRSLSAVPNAGTHEPRIGRGTLDVAAPCDTVVILWRLPRRPEIQHARGSRSAGFQGSPSPAAYSSALPGTWQPAQPAGRGLKGKWWEMFNEPELNALEEQLEYRQPEHRAVFSEFHGGPRAGARGARGLFSHRAVNPSFSRTVTAEARARAARQPARHDGDFHHGTSASNTSSQHFPAFRRFLGAGPLGPHPQHSSRIQYAAQVSAADLENERLTEQADLAVYYFQLRGQDAFRTYITARSRPTESARTDAVTLVETGIDSPEDVAQAEVTLRNAEEAGIGRRHQPRHLRTCHRDARSASPHPAFPCR